MATRVLQRVQGALESTAGTFANATRKLYGTEITHERLRQQAVKVMQKQAKTIKATGDLASLVRDHVHAAVEQGLMTPTLAEGLRAQEMIDRRQEKGADREVALTLAGILGGGATYAVLDAKEVKEIEG